MDWFAALTGFQENAYDNAKRKLRLSGNRLTSKVNGKSYGIGQLVLPSLQDIRRNVAGLGLPTGHLSIEILQADVRELHRAPEHNGAMFQVASQFNLLEMIGPDITPEHGVTRYAHDKTQGPACAMEAGAATIFRNYFAPTGNGEGQTKQCQIDALSDVTEALVTVLGIAASDLLRMSNGYALFSERGLRAIDSYLLSATEIEKDDLRACLRIGLHSDVEVTTVAGRGQFVNQAFCSALPVAHSVADRDLWKRFATLILEAAYEATLLSTAATVARGGSAKVFLTMLGGGAFGNDEEWILAAMERALTLAADIPINVKIVSYGRASDNLRRLVECLGEATL